MMARRAIQIIVAKPGVKIFIMIHNVWPENLSAVSVTISSPCFSINMYLICVAIC